jgi:hypothetical protein
MDTAMQTVADELQAPPSLDQIYTLQRAIGELPQVDLPLLHHFSKGVYARSIFIPKDTVAVGKMHGTEHLLIMARGDIDIMTSEGMQRLRGFNVINSLPGIKRAVRAYEDTILTTIHLTDETDLDKIEAEVIVPDQLTAIEGDAP